MPKVKFTSLLKRFYPNLDNTQIKADTIYNVLQALDSKYPGLKDYLLNERGELREHVNIFIGEERIQDTQTLKDIVREHDEIFIAQAVSGG